MRIRNLDAKVRVKREQTLRLCQLKIEFKGRKKILIRKKNGVSWHTRLLIQANICFQRVLGIHIWVSL